MSASLGIRPSVAADIPALNTILDRTGLFPSEMLPEMIAGFLSDEASPDLWLTCQADGEIAGFCYAVPETLTEGTWNMLALAVLPSLQGSGCGAALVAALEADLTAKGQRIVIVDTSGSEAFTQARAFYAHNGYTQEARIRDFWAAGDDKIIFWKSLV